jgi:hypothetical protein
MSFLNSDIEELSGKPIDLAGASAEGLNRAASLLPMAPGRSPLV